MFFFVFFLKKKRFFFLNMAARKTFFANFVASGTTDCALLSSKSKCLLKQF